MKSMHYHSRATKNNSSSPRGISIVEIVVYIALLGMFSVFIVNFLIHVVNAYHRARMEREVLSNGRLILETVTKTIAQAEELYAPTSRFNDDAGQLSLITALNAPAGHSTAYADFWVDSGLFFSRYEGQGAARLSSPSVRVTSFRIEWIMQGIERESVRINLRVDSAQQKFPASITLNATAALRGSY